MARQFTAIMSPQMITELRDAARYPRVRRRIPINDRELATFLDELERAAVVVDPSVHIEAARDPDDNRVLEAAVAGDADYIVTGDGDLLALGSHDRIQIVTPAAFTTLLPQ
jgi:putative PIN family toxin of toxin-antitoxin system